MYLSSLLTTTALLPILLLPLSAYAQGSLYPRSSPVLQLDPKLYEKAIARSNYTSIVEFYAPWCGHCKNLKPAFEKAATSLSGLANVAAVDCDHDSNKPLCGQIGVQGFPTLKIVKPARKKGGKPAVEDYQGERSARGIKEAVLEKMPNLVTRVKDEGLEGFLGKEGPKGLVFSEKALVPPVVKALAIDFKEGIEFGFSRNGDKKTVERFGIKTFPTVLLFPGGDKEAIKFEGEMKKPDLVKFFSQVMSPHSEQGPDPGPTKGKPESKEPSKKPSASPSEPDSPPTTSPDPNVASDSPPPVQVPVRTPLKLTSLNTAAELQKASLHPESGTCVLALLPPPTDSTPDSGEEGAAAAKEKKEETLDNPTLRSLAEIADKHTQRGAKIFPFYSVPASNAGGARVLEALGVKATEGLTEVLAVNAKRAWWMRYEGESGSAVGIEGWVDGIRFGEGKRGKLPEGVVEEVKEEEKEEKKEETEKQPKEDKTDEPKEEL
ncbi:MAG: hypothetical protein M1831_000882 [Alyxoria varia]|nr:MAG: hypothetical protein M1831_000882 [Alyxoria varia]